MGVKTTRVVKFIRKGEKGEQGNNGRLPVPHGQYDSTVTYVCTDTIAPYVLEGQFYYVMNKTTSYRGATVGRSPAQDYAAYGSNATWLLMENYKAIFVEMLMANFGKIASAVFYGSLMFSQQGTVNGADSTDYSKLATQSNGDVRENSGDFIPNIWMNFANGKAEFNNVVVKGKITADFLYRSTVSKSLYIDETTYLAAGEGEIVFVTVTNNSDPTADVNNRYATLYLPTAASAAGQIIEIYADTAGAYGGCNTRVMPRSGSISINGSSRSSITVKRYTGRRFYSDGAKWHLLVLDTQFSD